MYKFFIRFTKPNKKNKLYTIIKLISLCHYIEPFFENESIFYNSLMCSFCSEDLELIKLIIQHPKININILEKCTTQFTIKYDIITIINKKIKSLKKY